MVIVKPGEYTRDTVTYLNPNKLEELDYGPCNAIWTLTTGRSGTTWLTHVLAACECLDVHHEPFPALFEAGRWAFEGMAEDSAWRVVRQARAQLVRHAYQRQRAYVECSPFLAFLAPGIKHAFAGSRFVHLWRRAQDFVPSAMNKGWYGGPSSQSHWFPESPYTQQWQSLIWFWARTHREALRHEGYRVSAHDLWSDPDSVVKLLEWCGVPEDTAAQNYGAATRGATNKSTGDHAWLNDWNTFLYEEAGDVLEILY